MNPVEEIGAVAREATALIGRTDVTPAERAAFFARKARLMEAIGQPDLAREAWETSHRLYAACMTGDSA